MNEKTHRSGLDGLVGKAKEFLTDERIDQLADKAQGVAPDNVDPHIDRLADKAKDLNGPDRPGGDRPVAGRPDRPVTRRPEDR